MNATGRIAVFGDIHANLEALEAVIADAAAHGVSDWLCTGDIVGYGASPAECLERVRSLGCPVVKGNHDHYVAARTLDADDFNPAAAKALQWTRDMVGEAGRAWLDSLPFTVTRKGVLLVHATMDRPEEFGYVFDNKEAETNFIWQKTPLCFHGHTHCPMIYEKSMTGVYRIDPQDFRLAPGRKYFINAGSVGQPRDGDPRASYMIYTPSDRSVEYRRVEYDIRSAQARILDAGLPERLALRLAEGR